VNRYAFLDHIIGRLHAENWRTKLDSGYSDYDLEIAGSNWARLRLTTATVELESGRCMICCRLNSSWTFRARAAFWLLLAAAISIVGLLARVQPWLWMLFTLLPVLDLFLNGEKWRVQRMILGLLDEIACEQKLIKLEKSP
jgi:hypothetical protein